MRSTLSALVAVLLCTLTASRAFAGASLTPLGDLPGGSFESRAGTVSDDGSVVGGTSYTASGPEAFRWTAASDMQRLWDVLLANGVNPAADGWTRLGGAGVSADGNTMFGGGIRNGNFEAFRWASGGPFVRMGDLPGGSVYSVAYDVSGNGSVIVGQSDVGFKDSVFTNKNEAFRWTSSGGIVGLGVLPGENSGTSARGVSGDGSVAVGVAFTGGSEHEAFRWTASSGMVLLGDFPGYLIQSRADAANHDGSIIVGYGHTDTAIEAFLWTSDGGMVGLGVPDGIFNSLALDVSDDGSVVVGFGNNGTSIGNDGYEALIWTSEAVVMERLWDVLLASGVNPAADGWTHLSFAEGISADGSTIVGYGLRNGNTEVFVAVIPEPAGLMTVLAALGVLAVRRRRRRSRVTACANAKRKGLCPGQSARNSRAPGVAFGGREMKSLSSRNAFPIAVAAALFWMSGMARADIGVNFNQPPGNNSVPPLAPTDVAGVGEYAQANYNNVSAIYPSQASNVVLNDHTGAATTATLTTTGAIFTAIAQLPTAGPDEAFNLGIAYSQSPWSWTVNDIPYASYDIIVYVPGLGLDRSDGNWGGVSIGGTTFYTKPPVYNNPGYFDGDPETPFPYVGPGPSDPVSLEYGTNYVQFSNLTGSSQTISISQQFIAATVGGFQIVGVPEPTTSATLLGLGLLGCGRAPRRKRA